MSEKNRQSSIEDQISENLRRAFRQRAEEGVPERFLDLLNQMRELEESKDDPDK